MRTIEIKDLEKKATSNIKKNYIDSCRGDIIESSSKHNVETKQENELSDEANCLYDELDGLCKDEIAGVIIGECADRRRGKVKEDIDSNDEQILNKVSKSSIIFSDKKYPDSKKYEMVNHPYHYNTYSVEVIDMMTKIYGREATALWCEMTAFKYRMRMGSKPENDIKQDIEKERWYLSKAKELRN